ncbi:MAG TPA: hypothetical protein DHN33_04555 [Eubacteriaceae bacterium]|nr:hypothetical protein [Eubacteriaceae bacterium]
MKDKRGFTLAELIVTLGLITLVVALATTIFLLGYQSFARENEQTANTASARQALDYVVAEIRKAENVSIASNRIRVDGEEIHHNDGTKRLYKGDALIASNIDDFQVAETNGKITVEVGVTTNRGETTNFTASIYVR